MPEGRIDKAILLNLENGEEIAVQWNPSDYQIEKDVGWKEQEVAGRDAPGVEFTAGGRKKLSMQLCYDTSDTGGDVREQTSRVEGLATVDRSLASPRPPRLLFRWGGFEFRCVLQSCSSRYLLFAENGVPLRAELRISLGEFVEEDNGAGGSAGGPSAIPEMTEIGAEERIDQVAERVYGDPAAWPLIAEASGIEDPLDLGEEEWLSTPQGGGL